MLSQKGMRPLQASTVLGESSEANTYSDSATREISQCGRMWQDTCNDRCIMLRVRKWLAYLFSGGAFLRRKSGFLEYHAALDVVQGEGLCVGMQVVSLGGFLGLFGEHGALSRLVVGSLLLF